MITVFLDTARIDHVPAQIVEYLKLMDKQGKRDAAQKNSRTNPELLALARHWVHKPKIVFISWDGKPPDFESLEALQDDSCRAM
jgi:hypothetical protein